LFTNSRLVLIVIFLQVRQQSDDHSDQVDKVRVQHKVCEQIIAPVPATTVVVISKQITHIRLRFGAKLVKKMEFT